MSDALAQAIENIRNDPNVVGYDEASVRQGVVLRVLNALGWDPFDRDEVTPEFGVSGGLVDYNLQIDGKSKVFIEVKRGGEDLTSHQDQLLRYSFGGGVGLATLTNGLDWWFYLPLREGSWEQRRFSAISVKSSDSDNAQTVFANALSKNGVASGSAIKYGENLLEQQRLAMRVKETLPKAWQALISEPDGLLVDLLTERSESLYGVKPSDSQVRRFLSAEAGRKQSESPNGGQTGNNENQKRSRQTRLSGNTRAQRTPTSGFRFLGETRHASNWVGNMRDFAKIIYERHTDEFPQKVAPLQGRTRPYYSRSSETMRSPQPIGESGWFVETHGSAQTIRNQCIRLATAFGYNESDIEFL